MRKDILGPWGAALGDADYACALAALGVLEATGTAHHRPGTDPAVLAAALSTEFVLGERTPVWRDAKNVHGRHTPESWRSTIHADAAALAAAWRAYRASLTHERQAPRLAVDVGWRDHPDLFDLDALCTWLRSSDVGLDALVLADAVGGPDAVAWHWPVQVGVPAGAAHAAPLAALRAAQDRLDWVGRVAPCFAVGEGRDACDLLLLTPAGVEEILAAPRSRLRATFVACLEDPPSDLAPAHARYGRLRRRVGAAGVAAVGALAASKLETWFVDTLARLSHDLPVHAAVRAPLVLGTPGALDRCRVLAVVERQDRVVAALRGPVLRDLPRSVTQPEPTFGGPTVPAASAAAANLRARMADEIRARSFIAESVDGVGTAADIAARASDIEAARPPRWIQASAWRRDALEGAARLLAPEGWNLLEVHIGPGAPRADAAFPDAAIDFSRGDVVVTVQLELAGASLAAFAEDDVLPQFMLVPWAARPADLRTLANRLLELLPVAIAPPDDARAVGITAARIVLPPAGDSTLALFGVCPAAGAKRVEGRVAVIHANRVLQTARLAAGVGGVAEPGEGVAVAAEATLHPRDDDLDERRAYDVAIQVSDLGGRLHLAIQQDDGATPVQLDDLQAPIKAIRDALEQAALRWDYAKPPADQPVFGDTLYALAGNGKALEQHLRKACGDRIDGWERVHLVPFTNEFLPLEYLYDGSPPKIDAQVCPNMQGALERGGCEVAVQGPAERSACPHRAETGFVCPMHFWGFRRLIERNGTEHAAPPAPEGRVRSPVPSKRPYGPVRALVFGASQRAFAYAPDARAQSDERAALVETLRRLGGTVLDAADWDQWREQVKKQPNLLVLVAHTDMRRGTRVLEIGSQKFLGYQEILPDLSGAGGQPQLLLLLGCSAADVAEDFQPYPERFRDAGVSIVLAPVAPIRGADAVPIAKRIAERLAQCLAALEPTAFGELLPQLRRELLLAGHPGVMGLVGFGDGDWLLGGR